MVTKIQYVKLKKTGQVGMIYRFTGDELAPNCNYKVIFNIKKHYNDRFRSTFVLGKKLELIEHETKNNG